MNFSLLIIRRALAYDSQVDVALAATGVWLVRIFGPTGNRTTIQGL